MKSYGYFPSVFYSRTTGVITGILTVISIAGLLFSLWSICCLIGGFFVTAQGVL